MVYLDAYPECGFAGAFRKRQPRRLRAHRQPAEEFFRLFKLDKTDPHLLPDLSAALVIEQPPPGGSK